VTTDTDGVAASRPERPVRLAVRQSGVDAELAELARAEPGSLGHPGETLVALPPLLHICAYLEDELIGHVGLVLSAVRHGIETDDVAGLGHLLVSSRHRGHGIGGILVHAAIALAGDWDVRGILGFCEPDLVPFYERFGFTPAGPGVTVGQPGGRTAPLPASLTSVWRPLGPPALAVLGSFELLGLPF